MGSIISVVNRKGGVGKTTLSIALAETFVFEHKKNVIILDFDPQSSASETLLPEEEYSDYVQNGRTLAAHLLRRAKGESSDINQYVRPALHSLIGRGACNLALFANSADLWDVEWDFLRSQLEGAYRSSVIETLHEVASRFDIVIVDCPPGRTISTELALLESNLIICPVVPERLSVWGMDRMKAYFDELAETHTVPQWRFVISRAVPHTKEGERQIEAISNRYKDHLLNDQSGLFHIGSVDYLQLPKSERIVQRIAKFRDDPDDVRRLDQFYGTEVANRLKRIAKVALKDLESNG